jgi:hypothetical protein
MEDKLHPRRILWISDIPQVKLKFAVLAGSTVHSGPGGGSDSNRILQDDKGQSVSSATAP